MLSQLSTTRRGNSAGKRVTSRQLSSNYALFIGLRYSFSRKRNRFTAVIALVSMLGMTLGVTSLITVLSVMNGFAGELRGRILSLVPHGYVESAAGGIEDWQNLLIAVQSDDSVLAASPYISDKAILTGRNGLRGAVLTAIDPTYESEVSDIGRALTQGSLDTLDQGKFNVVMGAGLASALGVQLGDVVDQPQDGRSPRERQARLRTVQR